MRLRLLYIYLSSMFTTYYAYGGQVSAQNFVLDNINIRLLNLFSILTRIYSLARVNRTPQNCASRHYYSMHCVYINL